MTPIDSTTMADLPQLDAARFAIPNSAQLQHPQPSHAPRFLLLYGSLRTRSFSRLLTEEAARILTLMGGEVKIFNPSGLPLPDDAPETHSD
jgi:arsenic resistance protein ArsH